MKNKGYIALLVVLVAVLIIAIGGVYYFVIRRSQPLSVPSQSNPTSTLSQNNIHVDPKGFFSVQYPSGFIMSSNTVMATDRVNITPPLSSVAFGLPIGSHFPASNGISNEIDVQVGYTDSIAKQDCNSVDPVGENAGISTFNNVQWYTSFNQKSSMLLGYKSFEGLDLYQTYHDGKCFLVNFSISYSDPDKKYLAISPDNIMAFESSTLGSFIFLK